MILKNFSKNLAEKLNDLYNQMWKEYYHKHAYAYVKSHTIIRVPIVSNIVNVHVHNIIALKKANGKQIF